MRVVTGKVVGGKVEFSDESIEEGAEVIILAPATGALVQLSPAEEEELTEAMEQIRGGESDLRSVEAAIREGASCTRSSGSA